MSETMSESCVRVGITRRKYLLLGSPVIAYPISYPHHISHHLPFFLVNSSQFFLINSQFGESQGVCHGKTSTLPDSTMSNTSLQMVMQVWQKSLQVLKMQLTCTWDGMVMTGSFPSKEDDVKLLHLPIASMPSLQTNLRAKVMYKSCSWASTLSTQSGAASWDDSRVWTVWWSPRSPTKTFRMTRLNSGNPSEPQQGFQVDLPKHGNIGRAICPVHRTTYLRTCPLQMKLKPFSPPLR